MCAIGHHHTPLDPLWECSRPEASASVISFRNSASTIRVCSAVGFDDGLPVLETLTRDTLKVPTVSSRSDTEVVGEVLVGLPPVGIVHDDLAS
jgi:hypothetical protein